MDKGRVEVVQVPKGPVTPSDLTALYNRYRDARLRALKTYPEAFSSNYERESAFTDEQWAQRLRNPMSTTFVAVCVEQDNTADEDVDKLKNHEWMGMIVLLGPKVLDVGSTKCPWEPFLSMDWMQPETEGAFEGAETTYFAVSMFVLPEATKRGVGKMLVSEMKDHAREDGKEKSASKLHLSLIVERENPTAIRLYERCGFCHVDADSDLDCVGDHLTAPLGMTWSHNYDL
ncbi:hypothetical protein MferCBS31731_005904 [Microsporum ferrugineum]